MILHSWEKATSLHKFILLPRASLASTNSRISMFPFNSIRLRKIFTTLKLIFPLVRRSAGRNRCQIQSCLIAWRSTAYYVGMLAAYSVRRTIVHCGSDRKIRSLSHQCVSTSVFATKISKSMVLPSYLRASCMYGHPLYVHMQIAIIVGFSTLFE